MKKHYQCPCCDYFTLTVKAKYDIGPICFWEDNGVNIDMSDEPPEPNQ